MSEFNLEYLPEAKQDLSKIVISARTDDEVYIEAAKRIKKYDI